MLIAKHFETKQRSNTKPKAQFFHSMFSISFLILDWKHLLNSFWNQKFLWFPWRFLLFANNYSSKIYRKLCSVYTCRLHFTMKLALCSGNITAFRCFCIVTFFQTTQEPTNSWKTKWHYLSTISTFFHSSSMCSFLHVFFVCILALKHLWFTL